VNLVHWGASFWFLFQGCFSGLIGVARDVEGKRANSVYGVCVSLVHTMVANLCGFLADGAMEKKKSPSLTEDTAFVSFVLVTLAGKKDHHMHGPSPLRFFVVRSHYLDLIIESVNKHASLSTSVLPITNSPVDRKLQRLSAALASYTGVRLASPAFRL
jgi:hypothetical protein